jgi:hypothetical protein
MTSTRRIVPIPFKTSVKWPVPADAEATREAARPTNVLSPVAVMLVFVSTRKAKSMRVTYTMKASPRLTPDEA